MTLTRAANNLANCDLLGVTTVRELALLSLIRLEMFARVAHIIFSAN